MTIIAERSKSFAGRPNSFAGRPNSFAGRPKSFAGRPKSFAGRPKSFAGRPIFFSLVTNLLIRNVSSLVRVCLPLGGVCCTAQHAYH